MSISGSDGLGPSRPREDAHADLRPRIERALAFIAGNLDRPLTVAEVAKVAGISEFHFHRVFASVMGEPAGAFITRKRLETAALMLAYHRSRSVTEIALATGYSSTANFSKAFAAFFGCRPSDVRTLRKAREGRMGKLSSRYGKEFRPADLYALPEAPSRGELRERARAIENRGIRFEDWNDRAMACLASPAGYDLAALLDTWEELIRRARQIGLATDAVDAFGIAHDSPTLTAPELCRYHACVPLPEGRALAPPLFRSTLPRGRYAIFRYDGPVTGVEQAYRDLYSVYFPETSLVPDEFFAVDHYVNDAPRDGHVDMEICIKVRPR